MNKDTNNDQCNTDLEKHSDDAVSALMNLAGPRAQISADIEKRVHDNVLRHWQKTTVRKNNLRWAVPASLAATVLLALAVNFQAPNLARQPVGTIAYVIGDAYPQTLRRIVGDQVFAGEIIETGPESGLSISLADNVSFRISASSSVQLNESDEVTLLRGQVYADSGDRIYRDRHLTVNTPYGAATDIGTQFSVAFDSGRMSVAVREGRVDVAHGQSILTAEAGEKLILEAGRDTIFDQVSPYDPSWSWASSLAPDFDIRNRSLLDFLKWAARETGKSLLFSSDEIRMAAMGTQVVGSITDFTPGEALEAVLATTRFRFDIDEKSITIIE